MHIRWGVSGSGCCVEAKPDPGVMLPGYPPWVGRKGKHDCKPRANNRLFRGELGFSQADLMRETRYCRETPPSWASLDRGDRALDRESRGWSQLECAIF